MFIENTMPTYQETLAFLEQFANYEKMRSVSYTPGAFDLARMETLLAHLGDPHRRYKTIHVAGTKGKGSVCAIIESALRAAGYRTGLYTSPHLHTFCERIQVSGQNISRQDVAALVQELSPHLQAIPGLTWFEIVTGLGLLYFARQQVDAAVIEVGLGGRLDATNVISPLVSVITSLSLDHTAWLGNTMAQIAAEKAGIIKPGVPVVSAPQPDEALAVIEQHCRERTSPLTLVGRDWRFEPGEIHPDGQSFFVIPAGQSRYVRAKRTRVSLFVRLLGRHQLVNATAALAALSQAGLGGLEASPHHLREGLDQVKWPARFEVLGKDPLVVCDGAHNGDSARQLTAALAEWFPGKQWTFIFGASSDKDIAAMLDAFVPASRQVVLTRSRHPRAAEPERLAELVRARGGAACIAASITEALGTALAQAGPEAGAIATGSLFVAAEARAEWAQRNGQPAPETDE